MPQVAEASIPKHKLTTALKKYESGKLSLRGGARELDVSAPTFAAICRRNGIIPRPAPHYGQRGQVLGKKRDMSTCIRCRRTARWRITLPNRSIIVACNRHALILVENKGGGTIGLLRESSRRKPIKKNPPIPSGDDQEAWNRCRSWRRMMIAILSGLADRGKLEAATREYLDAAAEIDAVIVHRVSCGECRTWTVATPDDDGEANLYYLIAGVIHTALASHRRPPDFCAILRRHYPRAPAEFAAVGC